MNRTLNQLAQNKLFCHSNKKNISLTRFVFGPASTNLLISYLRLCIVYNPNFIVYWAWLPIFHWAPIALVSCPTHNSGIRILHRSNFHQNHSVITDISSMSGRTKIRKCWRIQNSIQFKNYLLSGDVVSSQLKSYWIQNTSNKMGRHPIGIILTILNKVCSNARQLT